MNDTRLYSWRGCTVLSPNFDLNLDFDMPVSHLFSYLPSDSCIRLANPQILGFELRFVAEVTNW